MKSKLGGRSSPLATGRTAPQTFHFSKQAKQGISFHAHCVSDLGDMISIHSHFLD